MESVLSNLMYYVVLALFTTSCSHKKNDAVYSSEYPIIIDINEAMRKKTNYKLSDVVDSITYIPVESIIGDYVTSLDPNSLKFGNAYIITSDYFS